MSSVCANMCLSYCKGTDLWGEKSIFEDMCLFENYCLFSSGIEEKEISMSTLLILRKHRKTNAVNVLL